MHTIQQLREQRANVWEQMRAIVDGAERAGRDLTAEEAQSYDRAEADLDDLTARIERGERHDARLRLGGGRGDVAPAQDRDDDEYGRVFGSFLRGGLMGLDPEGQALMQRQFQADSAIRNAAGVGTGSAGGYLVPPAFRDTLIETAKDFGVMLREAEPMETTTGANIPWPTADDTGNVGAILAENTQVSEQDVTIGTASLDAYMYTSKLVRVSFQLLQDRPDFDSWLARKLGERIGRIWSQHFTTGDGSSKPDGIVTSATVGVTGTGSFASTGGIAYDNLVDLTEALDPAYQGGAGLKWMMHQSVRKAARKLKDTTGRPIWEPSTQAGIPDTLLGFPLVINNDMATLAASSKSLGFGNIRQAYVARTVAGIQLLRLQERYADYLQVGFLAFARADGTLQDANAFKVFATTATA